MDQFIVKYAGEIAGVLRGFDRLVFRGTLRSISYARGMMNYLGAKRVRLTEFGRHVEQVSETVKQASRAKAEGEIRGLVNCQRIIRGTESRCRKMSLTL